MMHHMAPVPCVAQVTGNPRAKMTWGRLEHDGSPKITWKYGVRVVGWPADVLFQTPYDMSTKELDEVLRGVRRGRIYFEKINPVTLSEMALAGGEVLYTQVSSSGRVDAAQRWAPRRLETQSKKKIKRGIKTTQFVLSDD